MDQEKAGPGKTELLGGVGLLNCKIKTFLSAGGRNLQGLYGNVFSYDPPTNNVP